MRNGLCGPDESGRPCENEPFDNASIILSDSFVLHILKILAVPGQQVTRVIEPSCQRPSLLLPPHGLTNNLILLIEYANLARGDGSKG